MGNNAGSKMVFLFRIPSQHLHGMKDRDISSIGFGGLGVACRPLVPKFMGSNPAEAVGFLRAKKSSACLPSEGK